MKFIFGLITILVLHPFALAFEDAEVITKERFMEPVYKILRKQEWEAFQSEKIFHGSEHDIRDGFMHLSKASQVQGVIDRYFIDLRPLHIVKIDQQEMLEKLVWEPASSGEIYPHLYEALRIENISLYQSIME